LRLLFLNPIGNIGGAERVLLMAIAGVKRDFPSASIQLIMLADGPLRTAAREAGAEVEVVPLSPGLGGIGDSHLRGGRAALALRSLVLLPALRSFIRRLKAAVLQFEPDLVHSNAIKTHLLTRFAVPARVPVVWHIHDFYGTRPAAGWLLRRARARVSAAVAISNAVAADARAVLPGVRIEVVPNAVDLAHFAPGPGDGDDLDRSAGLPVAPPGTVRAGLVATYARWKGHLAVLDAAAKLAAEAPTLPVRWYIIGGPIYHTAAQFSEAELRAEVESRGLSRRIGFIPFAKDPVPIYRALDVVLHASTQPEPFGLTVAEAMACGRATVVSAAGGASELFNDGIDALGIMPGNVDQLTSTVRRLVEQPHLRASLGIAARQTAVARFDARQYGPRLTSLYHSIGSARP
jgi:glycosyltransferase involved in cell wall biosynthesis